VKIGILAAGGPPSSLQPRFGDYPAMFGHLLGGRGYDWRAYDVRGGVFPASADDCQAYVVTGSSAGVYEPDAWIGELTEFLRSAKGRARLVGVCFGHQAMAQAFGGRVIKSPKGWGIGLQTYGVGKRADWMDESATFSLPASHQDQVVEAPPGATVVAGNDFCPNGLLAWRDQPAISLQLHPEFSPDYAAALIEGRRGTRIAPADADRAIESLDRPNDHKRVAGWIARFLEGSGPGG
jgi:GMP synthase-like glutamine amidotransferase